MHSVTSVPLPIWGCLIKAEDPDLLGPGLVWHPVNKEQERFLAGSKHYRTLAPMLPELQSRASRAVEDINSWFKQEGFDIQMRESEDPKGIYLGSIVRFLMHWLVKGTQEELVVGSARYPAARLKDGVRIFEAKGHRHPVAELLTKEGYDVYLTVLDGQPDQWTLVAEAEQIVGKVQGNRTRAFDFEGVKFPFVDLDDKPDISWLIDMGTKVGVQPWIIEQALQQTRLQMNHIGARAESATGIGLMRGISVPKKLLVIDEPFLVAIVKNGNVVFSTFCAEDCWKDPGTIKGL
jgi:hypothetical protein